MPYRRLPNTDLARIRALRALADKGDAYDTYHPVVSLKTLTAIRNFLPKFEAARTYYAECYARQAKSAPSHQRNVRMARLYISHFIQVLNLAPKGFSAVDRNLSPLWKFYTYESKDGNYRSDLFWGMFNLSRYENTRIIAVQPFYSYLNVF